jgi:hypothetical protein
VPTGDAGNPINSFTTHLDSIVIDIVNNPVVVGKF